MAKRAKKGSARWWIKRLDALWSKTVRAKGSCEKCGRRPPEVILHADHIVTRAKRILRFDLRNSCCLCARCHLWWKHKEPIEFTDWIRAVRADDVAYIESKQYQIAHFTTEDYERIEAELKATLEEREGNQSASLPPSRSSRAA